VSGACDGIHLQEADRRRKLGKGLLFGARVAHERENDNRSLLTLEVVHSAEKDLKVSATHDAAHLSAQLHLLGHGGSGSGSGDIAISVTQLLVKLLLVALVNDDGDVALLLEPVTDLDHLPKGQCESLVGRTQGKHTGISWGGTCRLTRTTISPSLE
jgi:hypothetical protein